MRTVALIASCGAVAVLLHGCGGGGSSPTPSPPGPPSPGPSPAGGCINKQIDLVTQSVTGKSTGSLDTTIEGLPDALKMLSQSKITSSGDFTLKFDLAKFNVRLDTTDQLEIKAGLLGITAALGGKVIFDPSTKELALDTSINVKVEGTDLPAIKNCSVLTISEIPPLKNITQIFDEIKTGLAAITTCKGSDGTYDDWETKSIPDPLSQFVTASIDFHMDKDYLWNKIDMNLAKVDVETPIPLPALPPIIPNGTVITSIKASGDLSVNVDTVTKDPPSDTDLDYTKFGDKCTKLPPVEFKDVLQFLVKKRMESLASTIAYAAAAQVESAKQTKLVTV